MEKGRVPQIMGTTGQVSAPARVGEVARAVAGVLPLAVLLVLAVPFVVPFARGLYPVSADVILHLIRLLGLEHAAQYGDLWPRFLPGLHYGYGSPIFNYCGPISLYPALVLRLLGLGAIEALLWTTVLWGLVGMLGAYRLGKSLGGGGTAVVLGVAWLYSSQLAYFGNLAQFAAASFLPWVLWSFRSLALHRRRRDFVLAVAFLAAPVLTHNITAMVTAGVTVVYSAVLVWASTDRRRTAAVLSAAFAGALGVSMFVWLPALAERGAVQLERLASFDYRNYFLSLPHLLGFSPGAGGLLTVPDTLPWPQLILAVLAVGLALRPHGEHRAHVPLVAFAAGIAALLVFLMLPVSSRVWEIVPLMAYVEFPSRFLIPVSLMLAILSALSVTWVAQRIQPNWAQGLCYAACSVAIIALHLPLIDLDYHDPQPQANTVLDAHAIERETGWLSGTSAGEYLPTWVAERPHSWRFTERFEQASVFPRLEPNEGVTVLEETWGLKAGEVRIRAAEPVTLVFEWFYFPGWQAWVDGETASITPVGIEGMIGVDVPAGEHEVRVSFGLTPLRRAATLASGLVAAVLLAFVWRVKNLWGAPPEGQP